MRLVNNRWRLLSLGGDRGGFGTENCRIIGVIGMAEFGRFFPLLAQPLQQVALRVVLVRIAIGVIGVASSIYLMLLLACRARVGAPGRRISRARFASRANLVLSGTAPLELLHGQIGRGLSGGGLRSATAAFFLMQTARRLGLAVQVARALLQDALFWLLHGFGDRSLLVML